VDMRTDIYSLGVMLYEVLSGQPPFSAAEPAQLLVKHLHEAPPPLEKSVHGEPIPIELGRVVLRALSKDPAKRQQSVQELEHEFKIAVEAVAVDADETDTQVMRALPLAGHGEDRRGVLSSRILLGGVALCAVIAVFTLLFMLRGRMHLGRRLDMPAAKSANTPETLAQPLSTAAPDIPAQAWPPPFRLPPLVQEKPSAARELMLPPPGERQLLGILAEQTTPHDAPPRYPAHGWYLPFGGHMPLIGAKEREANLRTRGVPAIIQPDFGGPRRRFQVYIGPYTSAEDAQRKAQELAQKEPALPKQMLGAPVQF
ncbi:MAG TPA: hypothetical protein PLP17_01955, partial [Oligoflexia bacterium]|nr:hypothetical protein [Oligoflexia bacterium]